MLVKDSMYSLEVDVQIYFVLGLDDESCDENEGEEPRAKNNSKPIRTRRQVSYSKQ